MVIYCILKENYVIYYYLTSHYLISMPNTALQMKYFFLCLRKFWIYKYSYTYHIISNNWSEQNIVEISNNVDLIFDLMKTN